MKKQNKTKVSFVSNKPLWWVSYPLEEKTNVQKRTPLTRALTTLTFVCLGPRCAETNFKERFTDSAHMTNIAEYERV